MSLEDQRLQQLGVAVGVQKGSVLKLHEAPRGVSGFKVLRSEFWDLGVRVQHNCCAYLLGVEPLLEDLCHSVSEDENLCA